ncbi:MAG: hypothetical protein GDA46_06085 [Bdellovibrionales bacterium]|nr:hypothetical protein [Bdellovibrionales bacterium]
MEQVKTVIKFDGKKLRNHKMDVSYLAPSLLALSEVFKKANKQFNGENSSLQILVEANIEKNCFELQISFVQTVWENISNLIKNPELTTIKQLLEWILIGTTLGTATGLSLFKLIGKLKNKEIDKTTIKENSDEVQIKIKGDNNTMNISKPVFYLYSNKDIRKKAIETQQPLKEEGYDTLEFYDKKIGIYHKIEKKDVPDDIQQCPDLIQTEILVSKIETTIRIKKPDYEGNSKWTIVYEGLKQVEIADKEWLKKFQTNKIDVPPNSTLKVKIKKSTPIDSEGIPIDNPNYQIIKIHKVILPETQKDLF